ncbi:allantoate permease [Colletotrichum orchidophilum]|uniref:chorismate synthase n=1 Tax=Colletotrichum orchidophilum TaxID=1209926 RepID=A0A1G4AN87_9PEZI|nr:allantoate permease [Colletotrichum orchidophilum]OHE90492.1 allantoate permease [Colletotrichum orchidophilum]
MALTESDIQPQLNRRRPGQSSITTPRNEKDRVVIQSGTEFGFTYLQTQLQTVWVMHFYLAEGKLIFSLISRNVTGQSKKSTALAMTFIGWAAGNMTAPQIFQAADTTRYRKGFTTHFCLHVLFNLFPVLLRFLFARHNMDKRKTTAAAGPASLAVEEVEEKGGAAGVGGRSQ